MKDLMGKDALLPKFKPKNLITEENMVFHHHSDKGTGDDDLGK